tara:strand:+ start:341 stop:667 length:327 start_codon:yes stop_codon:yes gene_type:complete
MGIAISAPVPFLVAAAGPSGAPVVPAASAASAAGLVEFAVAAAATACIEGRRSVTSISAFPVSPVSLMMIWMAPSVVVVFVGSRRLARYGGDACERDLLAVDLSAVHV